MRLSEHVANVEQYKAQLEEHENKAKAEKERLLQLIYLEQEKINQFKENLDTEIIKTAESVMYIRGMKNMKVGDGNSAIQDAIKWFATGKAGYQGLKYEYFGTKNYDHWIGQRCDCTYCYGPRHGSIIFKIGLRDEARHRELTDTERDACIYYLLNLSKILKTKVEVV